MQRPFIVLTLSSLLLGACGGDKNDSESESTGASTGAATTTTSDGTDSTIGVSSSPTTTGDDGSGTSNPTTTTTSASETSDTTDGGPDIVQLCTTWCGKNAECNPDSDPDGCFANCVENLGDSEPMCAEATTALLACMLEMTCEEFVAFTDGNDPGPCAAELDATEPACAGEVCTASIGGNEEGTECSYTVDCPDKPFQEVQCDADTCTCLEGGKAVGTCEADNVCMDPSALGLKAAGCCGF